MINRLPPSTPFNGQKPAYRAPERTPAGYLVLPLGPAGQPVTVLGGPFEAFRRTTPAAYGVCLNSHAVNARDADLLIPIPDFKTLPQDEFVQSIAKIMYAIDRTPRRPIYVGCGAGYGRTGMILAGLAKMAGMPDPVGYVRAFYNHHAVETEAQHQAVQRLDPQAVLAALAALRPASEPEVKKSLVSRIRAFFSLQSSQKA